MLTPLSDPPPGPAPSAACGGGGGAAYPHKMAAIFSSPPTLSPAGPLPRLPRPRPLAVAARRGLFLSHPPTPAAYTRVPLSSEARKAQRGHVMELPAAILWS